MQFELPKERPSIIKVIGVGGGGSNAVNYMYRLGIKGVDFLVCNTDHQALDISPVPTKVQLGPSLTEGRGAGSIPEVGKKAAIENVEELREILNENTKMVFITAGMGGGTGTGAAPIIAGIARDMGILTVAIVTVPFAFEGRKRKAQADAGIEELKKNVDTLLVICNDKLREIHGDLKLTEAFGHADNILAIAAKSIAEIITTTLHINVDFADIQTVMKDSGVAIMGASSAEGDNRAINAVKSALDSPLLNDNEIEGARYILLNITSGDIEVTMDEMGEINDFIQDQAGMSAEVIMGVGKDDTLGARIGVTVIATGFKTKEQMESFIPKKEEERVVYDLNGQMLNNAAEKAPVAEVAKPVPVAVVTPVVNIPVNNPAIVAPTVKPALINTVPQASVVQQSVNVPQANQVKQEPVSMNLYNASASENIPVAEPERSDLIIHDLMSDEEISSSAAFNESMNQQQEVEDEFMPRLIVKDEYPTLDEAPTFEFEIPAPTPVAEMQSPIMSIPPAVNPTPAPAPVIYQLPPVESPKAPAEHAADEDPFQRAKDRIQKLKEMSMRMNTPNGLTDLEKEPAYKRKNIHLSDIPASMDTQVSRYTLTTDSDNKPEIKSNNTFLHDRVD
ncbi:MAG: cell division protein FtsZ [Bacteroidetes bacterium]|nr:cell division protein FtsZ [Bacteroidota bacterium]